MIHLIPITRVLHCSWCGMRKFLPLLLCLMFRMFEDDQMNATSSEKKCIGSCWVRGCVVLQQSIIANPGNGNPWKWRNTNGLRFWS